MKKFLFQTLYALKAYSASPFFSPASAAILTYHGFTDRETHEGIANHQGKHVLIEKFDEQVRFLKKNYNLISLNDWLCKTGKGKASPKHSVILTMDDGYRSNYALAFPVLKKYDAPASIFVSTAFVEDREPLWPDRLEYVLGESKNETEVRLKLKQMPQAGREQVVRELENKTGARLDFDASPPEIYQPLQWPEIREMIQSGLVSIGSHTHSHTIATRCTPGAFAQELRLSKEIIERETQTPCTLFCYPNGGPGDYDSETKKIVQKEGFECALTTVEGFNGLASDLFELKRLGVRNQVDAAEFAMTLSGFKKALSDAKAFFGKA